ncbi:hypothetical protein PVA17_21115 [Lysinibacillus sp. CNPSo 3705]|uniref:hypothetical protein n=1 Tax=Lysinibacillus sp. CNPSo 3705 TaxID=3028148 RepID=UPI0023643BD4|nr:hypothetical protein [Lysinibacillus sp. CNPSo 3705]MDD1505225.1 hypothetical protein [Lysinibacillus sp. CNPSo 3705]
MTLQSFIAQQSIEDISSRFVKSLAKQSISFSGKQSSGCSSITTTVWRNMFPSYYPTFLIKFLMKGNQTTVISGPQGVGKTTLMASLIELVDPKFTIRTQKENIGFLHKLYPNRNIVPFEDTTCRYHSEEGQISVFDELKLKEPTFVNQHFETLFSIFTHYGKDLSQVVASLRNSFLQKGLCSDEKDAEQLVVNLIDFNIHVVRDKDGSRYIERITECVPVSLPNGEQLYEARNIVELKEGQYVTVHPISQQRQEMIECNLSEEDKVAFRAFNTLHWVDET